MMVCRRKRGKLSNLDRGVTWEDIQKIAFSEAIKEYDKDHEIMHYILEAQRLKVKLPVVREVLPVDSYSQIKIPGSEFEFHKGDTVIIDIHAAEAQRHKFCDNPLCIETLNLNKELQDYLSFCSGFSHDALSLEAKYIPVIGLSSVFKVLGQMKWLRQGHDSQGRLKVVNNSPSYKNIANRMAPRDIKEILPKLRAKAEEENDKHKGDKDYIAESFDTQPESSTYLTPEWDETLPFPNTMKVRFNGYGEGVWIYGDNSDQSHGIMTLYAPEGPSHTGGTWAIAKCPCAAGNCTCALGNKGKGKADAPGEHGDAHTEDCHPILKSLGTVHSGCGM